VADGLFCLLLLLLSFVIQCFLFFFFLQVVLALHYIHVEMGVVHRDLTPNNILLEHDTRRAKIADFGLAKVGRCRLTVSKPELKACPVSALETKL
jgi:serine/threonine protein kinase